MGYFDDNTYTLKTTINEAVADKSGCAYRPDEDLVYCVLNSHYIRRFRRDGTLYGSQTNIFSPVPGTWDDTEGLAWLGATGGPYGGATWAALNEGDQADYSVELVFFNLTKDATDPSNVTMKALSSIPRDAVGGAEGLDYDPVSDQFYVGNQSCKNVTGIGLWRTSTRSNDYGTQTLLWKWYDVLVTTGEVPSDAWYVGDVVHGRIVGRPGSIFVLVSDGSTNAKILELSLSNGAVVSRLTVAGNKTEGFCFDPKDPHDLFLCADNSGNSFWRYTKADSGQLRIRKIYTGEATSWATTSLDVAIGGIVDQSKSILLFNVRTALGNAQQANIGGRLLNSYQIRFTKPKAVNTDAIRWTVVEFASGVSVETLAITGITTGTSGTVSLGTAVPQGKGLLLASWDLGSGANPTTWNYDDFFTFVFSGLSGGNYASIDWARGGAYTFTTNIWLQVITFKDSTAVQDGNVSITGLTHALALSPSIDRDRLLIAYSKREGTSSFAAAIDDGLLAIPNADPATEISLSRTTDRGDWTCHVQAVALADGSTVQHIDHTQTDPTKDSTITLPTPVKTDRSVAIVQYEAGFTPNAKANQADSADDRKNFVATVELQTIVDGFYTEARVRRMAELPTASSLTYHIQIWEFPETTYTADLDSGAGLLSSPTTDLDSGAGLLALSTKDLPSGAGLFISIPGQTIDLPSGCDLLAHVFQLSTGAFIIENPDPPLPSGARITMEVGQPAPGSSKYWFRGLPLEGLRVDGFDLGAEKNWRDGLPVLPLFSDQEFIAIDYCDPWFYSYDNSDQYTAGFYSDTFEPWTWSEGPGIFGFGTIDSPPADAVRHTTLSQPPDNRSLYLRREFIIPDASKLSKIVIEAMRDDGVVIWVNGVEVGRGGPVDPITHGQVVAAWSPEGTPLTLTLTTGAQIAPFRTGYNSIAVMGFNAGAASTDLAIGLKMTITTAAPSPSKTLPAGARLATAATKDLSSGAGLAVGGAATKDLSTGSRIRVDGAGSALATGARLLLAPVRDLLSGLRLLLAATKDLSSGGRIRDALTRNLSSGARIGGFPTKDLPSGPRIRDSMTRNLPSGAAIAGASAGTKDLSTGSRIRDANVSRDLGTGLRLAIGTTKALASGLRLLVGTTEDLASGLRLAIGTTRNLSSGLSLRAGPTKDIGTGVRVQEAPGKALIAGARVTGDRTAALPSGASVQGATVETKDIAAGVRLWRETSLALSSGVALEGMTIAEVVEDVVRFPIVLEEEVLFPVALEERIQFEPVVEEEVTFDQ